MFIRIPENQINLYINGLTRIHLNFIYQKILFKPDKYSIKVDNTWYKISDFIKENSNEEE